MIPDVHQSAVARGLQAAFGTPELDSITVMTGGLSGAQVYRIGVGGIAYLLRIEGSRDAFRDPDRWYGCMRLAAAALLAPRVLYADPTDGVAIMDFIEEQSLTLDYAGTRADLITEATQAVRALHEAPAFPPLVDYLEGLAMMIEQLRASRLLHDAALAPMVDLFEGLRARYRCEPADLVSSHNDLNLRNILYDGRRLWFVDWESAFLADRYVDLATLANFLTSTPQEVTLLLQAYFREAPTPRQRASLCVMRQVNHVFYGVVMLNAVASQRPGTRALGEGLLAPDLAQIHRGLGDGSFALDGWEGQITYGKARLNAAVAGMSSPSFDQAVALLAA